jgi:hypothetical protein
VLSVPKQHTIEDMLEELRKFEQEAIQSKDIGRLLFTTEAEKSVGLVHLLTQKYDIIIMNSPHGTVPKVAKTYLQKPILDHIMITMLCLLNRQ